MLRSSASSSSTSSTPRTRFMIYIGRCSVYDLSEWIIHCAVAKLKLALDLHIKLPTAPVQTRMRVEVEYNIPLIDFPRNTRLNHFPSHGVATDSLAVYFGICNVF